MKAMEELKKEGSRIMEPGDPGDMSDAGISSAVQNVEHYEHASYERLRLFAELIGITEVGLLPEAPRNEVKEANKKLSEDSQSIS